MVYPNWPRTINVPTMYHIAKAVGSISLRTRNYHPFSDNVPFSLIWEVSYLADWLKSLLAGVMPGPISLSLSSLCSVSSFSFFGPTLSQLWSLKIGVSKVYKIRSSDFEAPILRKGRSGSSLSFLLWHIITCCPSSSSSFSPSSFSHSGLPPTCYWTLTRPKFQNLKLKPYLILIVPTQLTFFDLTQLWSQARTLIFYMYYKAAVGWHDMPNRTSLKNKQCSVNSCGPLLQDIVVYVPSAPSRSKADPWKQHTFFRLPSLILYTDVEKILLDIFF